MRALTDFKESLNASEPPEGLSPQLMSLWYDGKGDWHQAHAQIDHLNDQLSAWVHAYLHRKEGDIFNSDYWYNRAKKVPPKVSLADEWESLVVALL